MAETNYAIRPSDLLSTAIEADFGWFHSIATEGEPERKYLDVLDDFDAGKTIQVLADNADEELEWFTLTPSKLMRSIGTLARFRTERWGWSESCIPRDRADWDFDAGDADCVLQIATLGDVVYG